jgi:hypothetical protein
VKRKRVIRIDNREVDEDWWRDTMVMRIRVESKLMKSQLRLTDQQ